MGATLLPSKSSHRVYALSTHALPVIRCLVTDINGANLRLRSCENGLRSLHALSPLYGRLWNDQCGPLGPEYQHLVEGLEKSTFQIVGAFSTSYVHHSLIIHTAVLVKRCPIEGFPAALNISSNLE